MNDDELLGRLRRVLDAAEPEPPDARRLAYAALGWRDLDVELAELVFDSAVHEAESLVRSAEANVRLLTFSTADVTIEVELAGGALIGQVIPTGDVDVTLVNPEGVELATTQADELGVFTFDPVPTGPTTLVCRARDGSWSVRTAWTSG